MGKELYCSMGEISYTSAHTATKMEIYFWGWGGGEDTEYTISAYSHLDSQGVGFLGSHEA